MEFKNYQRNEFRKFCDPEDTLKRIKKNARSFGMDLMALTPDSDIPYAGHAW